MDRTLKVVLVVVGSAVLLVGVQLGMTAMQTGREDVSPGAAAESGAVQAMAGVLAPFADPVSPRRLGRGCGDPERSIDLSAGEGCSIDIGRDEDTRFARIEVHVQEGGSLEIGYRPRGGKRETETVDEGGSATVPVLEGGGTLELRCRGGGCRVRLR